MVISKVHDLIYRLLDIPIWTVEAMFDHISRTEKVRLAGVYSVTGRFLSSGQILSKFDFIIWTGDLPPHNIWAQKRTDQLTALEQLTGLFKKYFSGKKIYSAIGNHETQPVNL